MGALAGKRFHATEANEFKPESGYLLHDAWSHIQSLYLYIRYFTLLDRIWWTYFLLYCIFSTRNTSANKAILSKLSRFFSLYVWRNYRKMVIIPYNSRPIDVGSFCIKWRLTCIQLDGFVQHTKAPSWTKRPKGTSKQLSGRVCRCSEEAILSDKPGNCYDGSWSNISLTWIELSCSSCS